MAGKNLLFAVVIVTLAFPEVTRTSAKLLDQDHKDDRKKVEDVPEAKPISKPDKFIRVPLHRIADRSVDVLDETINGSQRDGNWTFSGTNDASTPAYRDSKKNYKKLKMSRIQSKTLIGKEYSSDLGKYTEKQLAKKKIAKRYVDRNETKSTTATVNLINVDKSGRHKHNEYYAQRQAVMDRFYARQQEIRQKHGNHIATRNSNRYNLGLIGKNTTPLPAIVSEEISDYKRVNMPKMPSMNSLDLFNNHVSSTLMPSTRNPRMLHDSVEIYKSPDCRKGGNILQNHEIRVDGRSEVTVRIFSTYCRYCLKVLQRDGRRSIISVTVEESSILVTISNRQSKSISVTVLDFGVPMDSDTCE